MFDILIGKTYGKAVWDSLEQSFSSYVQYNDAMNQAFVSMFYMFDDVYTKRLEELKAVNNGSVSIKEHTALINELRDLLPAMPLVYSDSLEEGMLLMKSIKDYHRSQITNITTDADGILRMQSLNASVKKFANAGKAGAVLPIHFLDGMVS